MAVRPAQFVRWVGSDEDPDELLNEAKALTWVSEAEHLLFKTETGERVMVRGGRDGIVFEIGGEGTARTLRMTIEGRVVRIVRIDWHTHPRVTGPSDGDLEALTTLEQDESLIYELGGDPRGTRIRPKT